MPVTTTLNTTPDDDFMAGVGFGLRDARSIHPVYDSKDTGLNIFHRDPPNEDDDGRLHYPDGTIVDPGEDAHDPVFWDGLIMRETFAETPGKRVFRTAYIPASETLIVDKVGSGAGYVSHDVLARTSVGPERVGDPETVVEAIHNAPDRADAVELFETLLSTDGSRETLEYIAGSDVFQALLE